MQIFLLIIFLTFSSNALAQPIHRSDLEARPYNREFSPEFRQADLPEQEEDKECKATNELIERIVAEVDADNPDVVKNLPECYKTNRKLFLKVVLADPLQFEYASDILKKDENFVFRLIKADARILRFVTDEMLADPNFMERATYLNRDSLKYADPDLLDSKPFMKRLITLDSQNYLFASNRLKAMPDIANIALSDNGLLLEFAPDEIRSSPMSVRIAVTSDKEAFRFALGQGRKDYEAWNLVKKNKDQDTLLPLSQEKLEEFLKKNYVISGEKKNLEYSISNKGKFLKKNKLVERNYISKWQGSLNYSKARLEEELRLVTVSSRNYPTLWKHDFRKYPDLIAKIERFLKNHAVDQNTIDNLSATDLWVVKKKPLTLLFSLYLLRDSINSNLGSEFSDVTSLVGIAQKKDNKWRLSIAEAIFDNEIRVEMSYKHGHKKYVPWDLYYVNKNDTNPRVIFKIEDKYRDYFEIFEEQNGGKYHAVHSFEPELGSDVKARDLP